MQSSEQSETIPERLKALGDELKCIAVTLLSPEPESPDGSLTSARVRAILRARRLRRDYLGDGLFADPAWDMLLDLLAARLEGKGVTVSSLCVASGTPPTTGLRWLGVLEDRGLVVREPSQDDGRKVFVRLSEGTADALERYFSCVGDGVEERSQR